MTGTPRHSGKPPDLLLVGCVKTKLGFPAPADELFVSPLFRYRRDFAERSGAPWFILSARHGLVRPDQLIEPYDVCLARRPVAERRAWAARIVDELVGHIGNPGGRVIEIHAGSAHAHLVAERLTDSGAIVRLPLRGLSQGGHLAWYRSRLR